MKKPRRIGRQKPSNDTTGPVNIHYTEGILNDTERSENGKSRKWRGRRGSTREGLPMAPDGSQKKRWRALQADARMPSESARTVRKPPPPRESYLARTVRVKGTRAIAECRQKTPAGRRMPSHTIVYPCFPPAYSMPTGHASLAVPCVKRSRTSGINRTL